MLSSIEHIQLQDSLMALAKEYPELARRPATTVRVEDARGLAMRLFCSLFSVFCFVVVLGGSDTWAEAVLAVIGGLGSLSTALIDIRCDGILRRRRERKRLKRAEAASKGLEYIQTFNRVLDCWNRLIKQPEAMTDDGLKRAGRIHAALMGIHKRLTREQSRNSWDFFYGIDLLVLHSLAGEILALSQREDYRRMGDAFASLAIIDAIHNYSLLPNRSA